MTRLKQIRKAWDDGAVMSYVDFRDILTIAESAVKLRDIRLREPRLRYEPGYE